LCLINPKSIGLSFTQDNWDTKLFLWPSLSSTFNIHISRGYKTVPFVSILLLAFYARLFVCPSHCFMEFYLHIFACYPLGTRIQDFYEFVDSPWNAEGAKWKSVALPMDCRETPIPWLPNGKMLPASWLLAFSVQQNIWGKIQVIYIQKKKRNGSQKANEKV